MLTKEEVKRIATLARLSLTEEELDKFAKQLTDILDYVKMLDELKDILAKEKVEPTFQVTGLKNVTCPDEVARFNRVNDLLNSSPLTKKQNQIMVKSVF